MCVLVASFAFVYLLFFFFNDTATTEIYTLSLHDALPILWPRRSRRTFACVTSTPHLSQITPRCFMRLYLPQRHSQSVIGPKRSEEHTSELQSRQYLVCRLLLEKKKKRTKSVISRVAIRSD